MNKRLVKDLKLVSNQPINCVKIKASDENIFQWQIQITGPKSSFYENGIFKISLEFPSDYPFKPPIAKFLTRIYHPNIDESGNVCISLLKSDQWKPSTSIVDVLNSLVLLLKEPNPMDPLETRIAQVYQSDIDQFAINVKEWMALYCEK